MIDQDPEAGPGPGERTSSGWRRLSHEAVRIAESTHLVDRGTSEDVAQEALLTLCRLQYAPRSPVAWLRVTIRRLILRRIVRSKLERHACEEFFAAIRPHDSLSHEDRLALAEIEDQLSERSRELVRWIREGRSHQEIADLLGCAIHQVGPRIARALRAARHRSEQHRRRLHAAAARRLTQS
jgi:RNA polymerase sigma factor (sigma-70 family)